MRRRTTGVVLGAVLVMAWVVNAASGAELKVVQTHKGKDVVITILGESGQWAQGDNLVIIEFTSPKTGQPVDVGKVSLSTTMAKPGMAPMLVGAVLSPDKTPGRYTGKISFPDGGTRQVRVRWDGPVGRGMVRFQVPVR